MKPEKPEKSNMPIEQFIADLEQYLNALEVQVKRNHYYFCTLKIWFAHLKEEKQSPFPVSYPN